MEELENKGHEQGKEKSDYTDNSRQEIFSETVRAGKRTYFFDVKSTRAGEYYLTITESKRRFNNESGKFFYEKHKLFLYKEDFDKFADGFKITIDFIKSGQPPEKPEAEEVEEKAEKDPHTDLEFEDLGTETTEIAENADSTEEIKD